MFAYRRISKVTVEERLLEMQKEEQSFAEAMISEDASLISSLNAEVLTMLLSSWTLSEQIPSFFLLSPRETSLRWPFVAATIAEAGTAVLTPT